MKTATFTKYVYIRGKSFALYELSEPITRGAWGESLRGEYKAGAKFVLSSTADAFGYWETALFPCKADGSDFDLRELCATRHDDGEYVDGDLFESLGYEIVIRG